MGNYIALKILTEERDKLVKEMEQEQLKQRNPALPKLSSPVV